MLREPGQLRPPRIGAASLNESETEQLRELVMTHWDPIGVHMPENGPEERETYWNECDECLPVIADELEQGDGVDSSRSGQYETICQRSLIVSNASTIES
jgi:hypothetical protein